MNHCWAIIYVNLQTGGPLFFCATLYVYVCFVSSSNYCSTAPAVHRIVCSGPYTNISLTCRDWVVFEACSPTSVVTPAAGSTMCDSGASVLLHSTSDGSVSSKFYCATPQRQYLRDRPLGHSSCSCYFVSVFHCCDSEPDCRNVCRLCRPVCRCIDLSVRRASRCRAAGRLITRDWLRAPVVVLDRLRR